MEVCENCLSIIGSQETPHVFNENVVCSTCASKLNAQTNHPPINAEHTKNKVGVQQTKQDQKKFINNKALGLMGSITLFIGVFTPIISIPMIGNRNYFQNGKGDGTFILILAIISFILVLKEKYKRLWFTGIGSLIILTFTFVNFQMTLINIKNSMGSDLENNPFRGLVDMAMQSVQLQWGWALLVIGSGLVIASAATKSTEN